MGQLEVQSQTLSDSISFRGTESNCNLEATINHSFTDASGKVHEENTKEFIRLQLQTQKNAEFTSGTADAMKLPLHRAVSSKIESVQINLENRLKDPDIRNVIRDFRQQSFDLVSLNDKSQIQVDMILKVEQIHGLSNVIYLGDNRISYELRLPCIIQIEATLANYQGRLFHKFLRGVVSSTHFVATPSNFFYELDGRSSIQGYHYYYVVVTKGKWIHGVQNMMEIHKAIINNNDELASTLNWNKFDSVTLHPGRHCENLSSRYQTEIQNCLLSMPFGILNMMDIALNDSVKLDNGKPIFRFGHDYSSDNSLSSHEQSHMKKRDKFVPEKAQGNKKSSQEYKPKKRTERSNESSKKRYRSHSKRGNPDDKFRDDQSPRSRSLCESRSDTGNQSNNKKTKTD